MTPPPVHSLFLVPLLHIYSSHSIYNPTTTQHLYIILFEPWSIMKSAACLEFVYKRCPAAQANEA